MLENAPTQSTMTELLGQSLFEVWQELCSAIDEKYDMERLWNTGGKNWTYEYKYRRSGKWIWRTDNEMAQKRQRFADDRVNQLCYNSYAGNYKLIYYNQCTALLLLGGNTVLFQ